MPNVMLEDQGWMQNTRQARPDQTRPSQASPGEAGRRAGRQVNEANVNKVSNAGEIK